MYCASPLGIVTTGRNSEAEKWFLESIRLTPDQSNVYSNLGSLYGMTGRPTEAEKMFKKAVMINPNYIEAYFNLGKLALYRHGGHSCCFFEQYVCHFYETMLYIRNG